MDQKQPFSFFLSISLGQLSHSTRSTLHPFNRRMHRLRQFAFLSLLLEDKSWLMKKSPKKYSPHDSSAMFQKISTLPKMKLTERWSSLSPSQCYCTTIDGKKRAEVFLKYHPSSGLGEGGEEEEEKSWTLKLAYLFLWLVFFPPSLLNGSNIIAQCSTLRTYTTTSLSG